MPGQVGNFSVAAHNNIYTESTLFEKMLEDISFNAGGDMPDVDVTINGDYVAEHLGGNGKKLDMRQYIL